MTTATRRPAGVHGSQSGLRDAMPTTAAIIDDLRSAFGADEINAAIRDGMQGGERFYACEAGLEIGRRVELGGYVLSGSDMVLQLPERKKVAR